MMLKTLGLVVAVLGAAMVPAMAQSACQEPIAPAAVDGAMATTSQMEHARDDVLTFIKQSDDYQTCLLKEFSDGRDEALKNKKTLDPSAEIAVQTKISENQHLKEKVGEEYNDAVKAYKGKHPSG